MSIAVVAGVVVIVLAGIAYLERASIKADALEVKAIAEKKVATFEQAVRIKETNVRAKIYQDVAKVIADVKAYEVSAVVSTKDVIAQFEARLKQIL